MNFLRRFNLLTFLIVAFLLLWVVKVFYCERTETGWLTLENRTLDACYLEEKGNSYLVRLKPCGIMEGRLEIICPQGKEIDRVIIYGVHGEFKTEKVIYEF